MKSLLDIYDRIENEYSNEIEKLGGYLERSLAFDAVWVMAYALNQALKKFFFSFFFLNFINLNFRFGNFDNFQISNYNISNFIKESMKSTYFKGISVIFN